MGHIARNKCFKSREHKGQNDFSKHIQCFSIASTEFPKCTVDFIEMAQMALTSSKSMQQFLESQEGIGICPSNLARNRAYIVAYKA